MPQLIWSPAALRDVDRLHRFLVEKNASAAREAIKAVRTHVNILAEQPGAGRPAEHMDRRERDCGGTFPEGTRLRWNLLLWIPLSFAGNF